MALTPQQVHDQTFRLVRQSTGYDVDEVDAFLELVEAELRGLHAELARSRELAAGGSAGSAAGSAAGILAMAQRTADEHIAAARAQADGLVAQAEARRATLEAQAADLARRVDALRDSQARLRAELVDFLESRLRQLRP